MACCCCWQGANQDEETEPLVAASGNKSRGDKQCETIGEKRIDATVDALAKKQWYHGKISNDEADRRLYERAKNNDGSYLVYDNPRGKGQYILLVYHTGNSIRWKIQKVPPDDMYILGEDGPGVARYRTVKELIKAHRGLTGTPIKLEHGGVVTLSKFYVSR